MIKPMEFEYTSRADLAFDIRDVSQFVEKINEMIELINKLEKMIDK